jgi:ribose-phosphate pyrophosphokinase
MVDNPQRFVTYEECQAMIQKAVSEAILKIIRAPRPFKLFGLNSTRDYAVKVSEHLGISLTPHTEKLFEDGECYLKSGPEVEKGPLDGKIGNVRGHTVFVIQSLYTDQNESVADKFVKLCIFLGSLRDASAHEIIPIITHLGWDRQDRKSQSREPITTKYIAMKLEAMGISRALLFDVHNLAAEQNAFRVPVDILEAKNLFADWFAKRLIAENKARSVKVMTPDSGGLSRCTRFRNALLKRLNTLGAKLDDIEIVIFDKLRIEGKVRGGRIVGSVEDSDVIVYDDVIATASTMKKACKAVEENKGRLYALCATHGHFCGKANDFLDELDTKIVVADTIQPWRLNDRNKSKLHAVDTTKMVAEAIMRIHSGSGSISELLRS